jgi:GDP-mannose 6-dehydrogenase
MKHQSFQQGSHEFVPASSVGQPVISIVGLGYVGAVSTACLADLGHRVIGVDLDQDKVSQVGRGESPIHEEGLQELLSEGVASGLVKTSTDLAQAVRESDVTFISVGTPTSEDGGCDHSYIEAAARSMAVGLCQKEGFHVFVMRCSIPPGTTMKVMVPILEKLSRKQAGRDFGVCFNPEFLREGVAIEDFRKPPKTVIGTSDMRSAQIMRGIYQSVDPNPIFTTVEVAETIKYVDNVWHATKVCFANEIGRLCKPMGVDSHEVMDIFIQDRKLNLSPYYLKPGFAYGGSCLPKEVRAVTHIAQAMGVNLPLIANLDHSNQEQMEQALSMVLRTGAKRVGVLGLAFKPDTDDLRESPILQVMAALNWMRMDLCAHDAALGPDMQTGGLKEYLRFGAKGMPQLLEKLPDMLCDDPNEVFDRSDVVIVCHATEQYRETIAARPDVPVIVLVRLFPEADAQPHVRGIGW